MDDEINVLSSYFPVSVNNVRSSLNITRKRRRKRKKSVDIIDLDLIEERRRKIFPSFVPLLLKREREKAYY